MFDRFLKPSRKPRPHRLNLTSLESRDVPETPLKEIANGQHVEALIHDSDAKKFYAFTKDQYFEIADPIQPKPHTLTIRREPSADKALEIAAKCGRVIRGLPEPKGK